MDKQEICLRIYSCYNDGTIRFHSPFRYLWYLFRTGRKHIVPPILPSFDPPKEIKLKGRADSNGLVIFNNNVELVMKDYYGRYKVSWKTDSNTISFYSPLRDFNPNRLYLNVDSKNRLSTYSGNGSCVLSFIRLAVKTEPGSEVRLRISPDTSMNLSQDLTHLRFEVDNTKHKVRVYNRKQKGSSYELIPQGKFKELYRLARKTFEVKSIEFPVLQSIIKMKSKSSMKYTNIYSKDSFQSIFTVTTQIEPAKDRRGYYGIAIQKSPDLSTSARVGYRFRLSKNILPSPDVIVTAIYYDSNGEYTEHKVYDPKSKQNITVSKTHLGPYPSNNNIFEGELLLESTAIDVALIVSNSLYGLLPENGEDPDEIVKFEEIMISYDNMRR